MDRLCTSTLVITALLCVAAVGCASSPTTPDTAPYGDPLHGLSWLVGTWGGTQENGLRMQEHWTPSEGALMLGVNRTIRGPQAIAFEFLRIEARDEDAIVYVAQPNGLSPGVDFPLIESSEGHAIFANPEHDFPQRLTYTRVGDHLTVVVEAEKQGTVHGFTLEWDLEASPSR